MTEQIEKSGIRGHHKKAIINLVNRLQQDSDYLAVIITGSVAKGLAREDSDIDCYLVVKDEIFQDRKQRDRLFYYAEDGCDYKGGYYDGKIINSDFLQAAVEKGSEPTRASFEGAIVAFSRIPNLDELVSRISVYPEDRRESNFKDFFAQVELYGGYFADRALALNNAYLLSQAVSQVALFAGRLILAYNRTLFPCHKSMMSSLERVPEKPKSYVQLQNEMLARPNKETISTFVECVRSFHDWGITPNESVSRFIVNNEWNWLEGEPPLSDR
ncbi:nucleotidyltransferase domain-containing protein [Paenibacillus sp. HWE-109]|uniref:nucleotidyltransferase domain-containing protein n=1 Tax=Paenibacillus sp. HWE-109 TaxID=1306526 RepID=UPI001EDE8DF8|nr:nucleotidyltransferase domain-containing protein [Paenibacillus sp. HWE-109]UKS28632.1 nucleotidyltransferase domain-containing protein [Paenibacillus sp. HWE-109]